ncbi:MAG: carbon storage regulator CsrA [Candidatus Scalindua sp.]|jgi:carbon storage regulator|nr:carbon storage regulator CsrA [Candidatus Scalindua sp.]MBT5306621.1 carbon storage regulator CsrA [Candidatus Scalindua sp.]MBT6051810.1 carbon storage regulator CsrA [Candidatus Scalindua sp.]MBT6230112.1 carbon storage regulator CsrA [Candidatus Scalindua sp.]MBT6561434.1 carbon storage regulator CsrA [Candidatus Scalindua sp.]
MLILTRRLGESIIIEDNIKITVIDINKQQIKLGIDAPKHITINREEIAKKVIDGNQLLPASTTVKTTKK